MLYGTLANVGAVIVGALLGLLLSKFFTKYAGLRKLPDALMKAISLFVVFIGIRGALKTENFLVVLISLIIGTTIGSLINIDSLLKKFGDFMEKKLTKKDLPKNNVEGFEITEERVEKSFSRSFVSTTLTCCVGAMSITGALEAGLIGDHSTLYAKSVLDFITAFVYSSTFGIGAIAAAVPIFLYQGIIELGAEKLSTLLSASVNEMSAVGSIIILGLGLNMLGATKIKIANMLPAIFLPILFMLPSIL